MKDGQKIIGFDEHQKELLKLLEKDPEKAMALIVGRYTGFLWKIAAKHLANPEDIKECVNDAFMEFYCHWDRFDQKKGNLGTYLAVIVKNQAISRYRRNKPRETVELQESMAQAAEEFNQAELRMDIENVLAELKPEDAEIIRMKYYGGMSVQEIADSLGLPYETVKKRHQRSVAKLRLLLALLAILLIGLLGACAYIIIRYFGIVPGYGVNVDPENPVYTLYGEASVETEFGTCIVENAMIMDGELWLWVNLQYHNLEQRERVLEDNGTLEWYLQTGDSGKEKLFGSSYGESLYESDEMKMRFILTVEEESLGGEDLEGILYGLGAELPFVLKKAEEEQTENYSHVVGERGGLLAIPRLDEGELKVELYPLDIGDSHVLPTFTRGLFMEGKTEDITVTAPDGNVLTGEMNFGESIMDKYTQWDFGPAVPGQYMLHVPYMYLAVTQEEPLSICFNLESCQWEDVEYDVPGGKLSVVSCLPLELEVGTLAPGGRIVVKEGASYWGIKLRYQQDENSDIELSNVSFRTQCERSVDLEELGQEELTRSAITLSGTEVEPETGCVEYLVEIGRKEYYHISEFRLTAEKELSIRWNKEFEVPLWVEE